MSHKLRLLARLPRDNGMNGALGHLCAQGNVLRHLVFWKSLYKKGSVYLPRHGVCKNTKTLI